MSGIKELADALKNIVGAENVSHDLADRLAYSHVAGAGGDLVGGMPDAIVLPGSPEEISRILQLANRVRVPVVPRAAGSYHAGTNVAKQGGIMVDLCRMNHILEINERNMVVAAEAGASVYHIMRQLDERGLRFPQNPQYTSACTIGAAVSCNISGARVTRYGRFGEHVVGLEVVLPEGEIVTLGSAAYPHGYGHYHRYMGTPDVLSLFVNAGGILGIVTKVAVRVEHRWEFTDEISYGWPRDKAKEMTDAIYWMQRFDVCDVTTLNRWNYHSALQRGRVKIPDDIHFVNNISVDGHSQEEYQLAERRFRNICEQYGGTDLGELGLFTKGAPRYHAWRGGAMWIGREFALMFYHPTWTLPQVYDVYESLCRKYGLWSERYIPTWFSNTEQNVLYTYPLLAETYPEDPTEVEKLRLWHDEIHRELTKLGCVQYLVGDAHPRVVLDALGPAYALVKRIKRFLDPNDIMNPSYLWR